ncbi:MAG: hypothetical protein ACUVRS_12390 [Armatimonadota bacterium]
MNTITYRSVDKSSNVELANMTKIWVDSNAPKSVLYISGHNLIIGGTEQTYNGGFESGLSGWNVSGNAVADNTDVHSGAWSAKVGGTGAGVIWQDVPISSSASRVFASVCLKFVAGTGSSFVGMSINDPETGLRCWGIYWSTSSNAWINILWDITRFKGSSVRLEFKVVASGGDTPATLYVDDVSVIVDGDMYVSDSTIMQIHSAEQVGVSSYEYNIDSSGFTEGDWFALAGSGPHTIQYRATDHLGQVEDVIQTTIHTDDDGPTGSILINDGLPYTASRKVTLNMSASDTAGVTQMRIKSDANVWGDWQEYQPIVSYTFSTTGGGLKTIGVLFRDSFNNVSAEYTDSIEYRVPVDVDIAGAKMLPDGSGVKLVGKVATAIFPSQGYFYVSEPNRTAGIRVRSNVMPLNVGSLVDVVGIMNTESAEREIIADEVDEGSLVQVITPVGITNARLGGAAFYYQPSVPDGAKGLNNIGLLVTTSGRVTNVNGADFYIDDGSKVLDSAPIVGILVRGSDVGLTPPAVGQYVVVTGISGASMAGGNVIRVLRPRNGADIRLQ